MLRGNEEELHVVRSDEGLPWRSQGGVSQASPPDTEPDPGRRGLDPGAGGILVEETGDRRGVGPVQVEVVP